MYCLYLIQNLVATLGYLKRLLFAFSKRPLSTFYILYLFKICLHIFKAHILKYPVNICERLQQHQPSRMLRSSSRNLLTEHRTSTSAGDRAFSNAGPALWNSLPDSCRKASSVDSFKKLLKTHLFCLWFWLLICVGHIQALCNLWKRRYINASLLLLLLLLTRCWIVILKS